jgi:hypothetical protein
MERATNRLQEDSIATGIVRADTAEGRRLLSEVTTVDHDPLLEWFEAQERLAFCSVATSVVTLNALLGYAAHRQQRFFTPEVAAIRPESEVEIDGMTLAELGLALGHHGARVTVHHADDHAFDHFHAFAIDNLHRHGDFVILNYLRGVLGQDSGGHFSPLGAWHEPSDRFLVLDVASYKYPPIWVPALTLFAAMATVDGASGRSRGYLGVAL